MLLEQDNGTEDGASIDIGASSEVLSFEPEDGSGERLVGAAFKPFKPAIPFEDIRANVRANQARGLPEIGPGGTSHAGRFAVICAAGASITEHVDLLKQLRADPRSFVIAVKGMWEWLIRHGIKPDAAIMLDPHPTQVEYVRGCPPDLHWYLSTQVDPAAFDLLSCNPVSTFSTKCKPDIPETATKENCLAAGAGVGTYAVSACACLGIAEYLMFGMDCSVPRNVADDDPTINHGHAYVLKRGPQPLHDIRPRGLKDYYRCTQSQAADFEWVTHFVLLHPEHRVFCHSFGMLRDGLAAMQESASARLETHPDERWMVAHILRPGLAGGFAMDQLLGPRMEPIVLYQPGVSFLPLGIDPPIFVGAESTEDLWAQAEEQAA